MKNALHIMVSVAFFAILSACDHSKPKPISNDIAKTSVTVNGKKDSVINNPEKNYGNATVSEPCVKCLIDVIQKTDSYKKVVGQTPRQKIIYDVNWITSTRPKKIGDDNKIINGMEIDVNEKTDAKPRSVTVFLYNNAIGRLYLPNNQGKFVNDAQIDSASLKKIRNSCFWGVASAK